MRKYLLSAAMAALMTAAIATGAQAYEGHGYGSHDGYEHGHLRGYAHGGYRTGGYVYPYYPATVVVSGAYYPYPVIAAPVDISLGFVIR